jgi:hypothetical protein
MYVDQTPAQLADHTSQEIKRIWDLLGFTGKALAGPVVAALIAWLKGKIDRREFRRERLRSVAETAAALRLCRELEHMRHIPSEASLAEKLHPIVKAFVDQELEKVGEQLSTELARNRAAEQAADRSAERTSFSRWVAPEFLYRVFLLFPPRTLKLGLCHALFYASLLLDAFFIHKTFTIHPAPNAFWDAGTMSFLLIYLISLSAVFNLTANYYDIRLSHPEPLPRPSLLTLAFLLYDFKNVWLWGFRVSLYGSFILLISAAGPFGLLFALPNAIPFSLLPNLIYAVQRLRHAAAVAPQDAAIPAVAIPAG